MKFESEFADFVYHMGGTHYRPTGEDVMLMARLQNLTLAKMGLDEAVELCTQAEALRAGYVRHALSSPAWLDDGIRSLDRFITDQSRDAAEMELRELAQADAADKTAGERRADRARRRAELETKLGKAPASV
jgi:hypothetical protein